MQQENERFERSVEMFCEAQNKQMEQTNAILTGFKAIFKDLAQNRGQIINKRLALLAFCYV